MTALRDRLAGRALRLLDPETAHRVALAALPLARPQWTDGTGDDARLSSQVMGLRFSNPIGVAAGFDKRAEAIAPALRSGFGFHEIGGITPRPQGGNPKPRVFRLPEERAIINRLGFNNPGMEAAHARLVGRRFAGPVGVNVGANKDSGEREGGMAADFAAVIARLAPVVDYASINVSSPNTPGLRDLQRADHLRGLIEGALAARDAAGAECPILVKIAPDLGEADIEALFAVARDLPIAGLVISNTTLSRDGVPATWAGEAGGLSGPPLFRRSTCLLARARLALGPEAVLVGVGGVDSPEAAIAKLEAGANLVQLYTGLVYEGIGLLGRIKRGIAAHIDAEGLADVSALVGRRASDWAG